MNSHRQIIELWPTRPVFAREVGVNEGVVNAWYRRDSIPSQYWKGLVQAAQSRGLPSVTTDLLASIKAAKRINAECA